MSWRCPDSTRRLPWAAPSRATSSTLWSVIDTALGPEELLAGLHRIEDDHGRVRAERWGPRTLDLDLIVMEGMRRDTAELTLPHPRASERRFVLVPLVEVWPDAEVAPGLVATRALDLLSPSED